MSSQAFSSYTPSPRLPLMVMLLVSLAVHLALLVVRPFGWLPSAPPSKPVPLVVTLAPPAPKHATAQATEPAAPSTAPTVALPPAPSHRIPAKPQHKSAPHQTPAPEPVLSRDATTPARPVVARPAKPKHAVPIERDAPPPSAGGHFDAQSLLAQGRNAARALDGADDAADSDTGSASTRRLLVYGRSASGTEWNSYVDAWLLKIERLGVLNYPEVTPDQQVRLRLTVVIDSSGALRSVKLLRSSGQPAFDQAALDLVWRASPFAPFPAQLAARASALKFSPHRNVILDNRFAGG